MREGKIRRGHPTPTWCLISGDWERSPSLPTKTFGGGTKRIHVQRGEVFRDRLLIAAGQHKKRSDARLAQPAKHLTITLVKLARGKAKTVKPSWRLASSQAASLGAEAESASRSAAQWLTWVELTEVPLF